MPRIQLAERKVALGARGLPGAVFRAEVLQGRGQLVVARLSVEGVRQDGARFETAALDLTVEALRDVAAALVSLADELRTPRRAAA